jgi:MutS-like protein
MNIKERVESNTPQNAPVSAQTVEDKDGPGLEYARRLKLHETTARNLHRRHIWTGNARVLVFAVILVLSWRIGKTGHPSPAWLVAAILCFLILIILHRCILRRKNLAERAVRLYSRGLARVEDRWSGVGDAGEQFSPADHLYAEDLDIFGEGGLFQLLCTARSRVGKERLSSWLLTQAAEPEIRARQIAVKELSSNLDLRERIALAGETETIEADPQKLKRWSEMRVNLDHRRWWPGAVALALLSLATLGYAIAGIVQHGDGLWTPFLLTLVLNGTVLYGVRSHLQKLFAGLDEACKNLGSLAAVFRCIEQETFTAPKLQSVRGLLFVNATNASECIARLRTLCDLEDSRHNQFVRVLELPLLYSLHVALGLQRWKSKYAAHISEWLDAVGEFEALLSVATYACEHPRDPFPDLCSDEQRPSFQAEALGHPLLPAISCVRNDVSLCGERQILLVSGSNMSGKSTLLRAVGVNAVLALMGAPVRAGNLHISPLAVGASMRISDSLQKGVSHFYAEITRIRRVVELSAQCPLLFLFDEILQGTNSHDRKIGAQGVLHTLLQNGAIGLITTHDLALTSLQEVFPHQIGNVHFQEKLEAGKLSFDYCLREGVVTTSNGLELMKSVGLEV